ncbi:hypothetical protein EDB83DRAFT_2400740 [Lactarius deliciosus]|nr:hypothetical protein EDB83DRAFT_2400740 [Lactarius deliciosus]
MLFLIRLTFDAPIPSCQYTWRHCTPEGMTTPRSPAINPPHLTLAHTSASIHQTATADDELGFGPLNEDRIRFFVLFFSHCAAEPPRHFSLHLSSSHASEDNFLFSSFLIVPQSITPSCPQTTPLQRVQEAHPVSHPQVSQPVALPHISPWSPPPPRHGAQDLLRRRTLCESLPRCLRASLAATSPPTRPASRTTHDTVQQSHHDTTST